MNSLKDSKLKDQFLNYLAGCEQIDFICFEDDIEFDIPSQKVWSYVATFSTEPIVKIPSKKLEKVSTVWWDLISQYDIIQDNECLISIGAKAFGSLPWSKVRIKNKINVVQSLSCIEGEPEFLCLSTHKKSFIGITTEEHAIWLFGSHIEKAPSGKLIFY